MTLKYPGKVAYEAWKRASNNPLMMNWEQMTLQEKTVWNDTVKAVLNMDKDEQTIGEVAYNRYTELGITSSEDLRRYGKILPIRIRMHGKILLCQSLIIALQWKNLRLRDKQLMRSTMNTIIDMNWKLAGEEHRKRWHELAKVAHDVTITNAACDGCDRD